MAQANQLSWEQFNRFKVPLGTEFFGVVTRDGEWVDSANGYPTACILGAQYVAGCSIDSMQQAMGHLQRGGISIIHGETIRKMYEAGLIK